MGKKEAQDADTHTHAHAWRGHEARVHPALGTCEMASWHGMIMANAKTWQRGRVATWQYGKAASETPRFARAGKRHERRLAAAQVRMEMRHGKDWRHGQKGAQDAEGHTRARVAGA